MKNVLVKYDSKNGIRFHHTASHYENGEKDSVLAETHDLCELFILLRGKIVYTIEGKNYQPEPLDVVLISPKELHAIKIDTSEPYERIVLHFSFELLPNLKDIDLLAPFKQAKHLSHLIPAKLIKQTNLLAHIEDLKKIVVDNSPLTDLHVSKKLHDIMADLLMLPESSTLIGQTERSTVLTVHTISQKCIQYINDHIHLPLNAEIIAKALNVSASHLQSTFKQERRISLHKYIVTQKAHLAAQMIHSGTSPQEAANALGYTYYKTFYRNFCQSMGYPPSWRPFYYQRCWVNNQEVDLSADEKQEKNRTL